MAMEINKLVFGGLIAGCLTAAGGGAYLATRHNVQDSQGTVQASPAPAQASPTAQPVTASEGVLTPEPAPAPTTTTPSTAPAARSERAAVTPRPAEPAPAPAPSSAGSMWETRPAVQAETPEQIAPEPEPVAPPAPEFVELTVPADAVVGLQLETTVSSERAKVEDAVEARVTRDVRVGGRVAIPAGSIVHGTVTDVQRGGKVRERARLSIRFHTVVVGNGDRLALRTDAITREGQSPGRESAAKIGGAAIGGAILGAILGGGKGAAIGAGVGAGGGTAAVMAGDANIVTIPAGSTVSVRIQQPVSVTVEKE
jgi:hypothetical protein